MVLEGGLDWKSIGISPKDMDFIEAKHAAAREIALAFGVPPMLLGIPGDNTYSNLAEANRALWRQTIVPLVRRVTDDLSFWLAPAFGGKVALEPDFDGVEALAEDQAQRVGADRRRGVSQRCGEAGDAGGGGGLGCGAGAATAGQQTEDGYSPHRCPASGCLRPGRSGRQLARASSDASRNLGNHSTGTDNSRPSSRLTDSMVLSTRTSVASGSVSHRQGAHATPQGKPRL